jgi:hypothetical protein
MSMMPPPVSWAYLWDAKNAAGADTPAAIVSEETVVKPNVTEADKSAFLKNPSRHTITESEDHIEAAQAVPILKRGLKSTI